MLSFFFQQFSDVSARMNYERDRNLYYSKILPVVAFSLMSLLITIEIAYRGAKLGLLDNSTSIVNTVAVVFFLFLCLLNKKNHILATWLVCPGLTALIFYYVDFVDFDNSSLSILYKMVIGITLSFFLLIFFNE